MPQKQEKTEEPKEVQWIHCLDDFKAECDKLDSWDQHMYSNARKEDYISCVEALDPKTDPNAGWEKCTTLKGLRSRDAFPLPESLSPSETIDLMDELQTREYAILDGLNARVSPFACVYLFDLDNTVPADKHPLLHAYLKSYLSMTVLVVSVVRASQVLDNEESHSQTVEIIGLIQNADPVKNVEELSAVLKDGKAVANDDIRMRVELRLSMLRVLLKMISRDASGRVEVEEALVSSGKISKTIREQLIPSRERLGAPNEATVAKLFPTDVRYWITYQVIPMPTLTFTTQVPLIADYWGAIANFATYKACTNVFDIITANELLAERTELPVTIRAVAACFVFGENGGRSILGGPDMATRLLQYFDYELGAPLYGQILSESRMKTTPLLSEVVRYALNKQKPHGGRPSDGEVREFGKQVVQELGAWLVQASEAMTILLQSSLCNRGRYHRRLANALSLLSEVEQTAQDLEALIFCTLVPQGGADSSPALQREYAQLSSVLSSFVMQLITDTMEKYLRLVLSLNLASTVEIAPLSWYIHIITGAQLKQLSVLSVTDSAMIPERVNNRANVPANAPVLTTRRQGNPNILQRARLELSRGMSELSMLCIATLSTYDLIDKKFTELPSDSLISVEDTFNHRVAVLLRARMALLPPYADYPCSSGIPHPLLTMLNVIAEGSKRMADEGQHYRKAAASVSSSQEVPLHRLEQSSRAMTASTSLLRMLIFGAKAPTEVKPAPTEGEEKKEEDAPKPPENPTNEEIAEKLKGYKVSVAATYEGSEYTLSVHKNK